jgi:hypothetical protein
VNGVPPWSKGSWWTYPIAGIATPIMGQVSKATQQKAGELPDKNLYVAICAQETTVVSETKLPLTNPTQCLNDGEKQPLDEDGSSLRVTQSGRKIGRDDAQKLEKKGCQLFGVEMSPDTVAIAMVYFVQGILSLPLLAVNFFLKDDLHLDPAEVSCKLLGLIILVIFVPFLLLFFNQCLVFPSLQMTQVVMHQLLMMVC